MTPFFLFVALAAGFFPGDGAVVMLPGVPVHPWEALSDAQAEEMWTYGIEGYQVTRSGWSGYVLSGPYGSSEILAELAETLKADSIMPDSSLWARTLQLVWNTNSLAGVWFSSDTTAFLPDLPVRTSRWLEAGPDTMIVSLPIENSVLFWAGEKNAEYQAVTWGGLGTEVVAAGPVAVRALVAASFSGSPGDLQSLSCTDSDLDDFWMSRWEPLLEAADSLVAKQVPGGMTTINSLVWIKGTGGQMLLPWTMIPSPPPPPVASVELDRLPGILPVVDDTRVPEMLVVEMPGNAGSAARAAYAAALLERIVARMAMPDGTLCKGIPKDDGKVCLYLSGVDWTASEALETIRDELSPIIFTSPEYQLLNNAAIKAGIPEMNQHDTITLLATVTGFLNHDN